MKINKKVDIRFMHSVRMDKALLRAVSEMEKQDDMEEKRRQFNAASNKSDDCD